MIREAIGALIGGRSLTQEEAAAATEELMSGEATPAQVGALLTALRMKGETADEIAGMARVMRDKALRVLIDGKLVDVVGTGGDAMGTFNISTAAALVTAAAGVKVAKHGNRAASSTVGSADILEANGVKLELSPDGVKRCIDDVGIGFMFAQAFHPAMRHAAGPRRELGVRTVFNILGPLTNPAGALHQLLGVADAGLAERMAQVLSILGTSHSWVVHGDDGLDEVTTTASTQVWEVRSGRVRHFTVSPEDAGLGKAKLGQLKPQGSDGHAALFMESLSAGESAAKDIVLLNAAAALVVGGVAPDLRAGVGVAREAIDGGDALDKLHRLAKLSQTLQ